MSGVLKIENGGEEKTIPLHEFAGKQFVRAAELNVGGIGVEDTAIREVFGATSVSEVNGEEGKLFYRGYAIQDLVDNASYEEMVHLLLRGDLPNQQQLAEVKQALAQKAALNEQEQAALMGALKAMPVNDKTDATALMTQAIAVMNSLERLPAEKEAERYDSTLRTVAVMPTLIGLVNARLKAGNTPEAMQFTFAKGGDFGAEGENFSMAKLTLAALQNKPMDQLDPKQVGAMDKYLILHAEHSLNLSTSTARMVASGESKMGGWHITIGAIQSLAGNRHGNAANEALENLKEIDKRYTGSVAEKVTAYIQHIEEAKVAAKGTATKSASNWTDGTVPGFGHKIYSAKDPRASALQAVLRSTEQGDDAIFAIAMELEKQLAAHPSFGQKQPKPIYPNVDFCSGVMLSQYLEIDPRLMTSMFGVSRNLGWMAHAAEQARNINLIARPEALALTPQRAFVAMEERTPPTQVENVQAFPLKVNLATLGQSM